MKQTRMVMAAMAALLLTLVGIGVSIPSSATTTGGSGGALTNRTFQTFTANGITSEYHIYASGLDWTKQVGLLMYADGSGGYGFDNPSANYLLGGTNGLINVAKKHNLLLVVPEAPAPSCDNYDNCWYNSTGTPSAASKAAWASALMTDVKGDYNIELDRVAIGGYSSGAQWTTRYFLPAHGESQSVDLAVPISYGGTPITTPSWSATYKANTVVSFDTGTPDTGGYSTGSSGARGGYTYYTNAGFDTDYNWVQGEDHSRDTLFGGIIDREVTQHLQPAGTVGSSPSPTPTSEPPVVQDWDTTVVPSRNGGSFTIKIPTTYNGDTYVTLSSGNYLYTTYNGTRTLTFQSQNCGTTLNWQTRTGSTTGTIKDSGTFTTLAC